MLKSRTQSDNSGRMQDVWDGSALRSMCQPGRYFSNKYNLTMALSTDGVALYKSSSVSIWPVYLIILNFPAHIRMNAENILLCAAWLGPTKNLMNLLLGPILASYPGSKLCGGGKETAFAHAPTIIRTFRIYYTS